MIGTWHEWKDHKQYTFSAPLKFNAEDRDDHTITEKLGYITFRGSRWNWFLCPAKRRYDWPIKKHRQGIAESLEEAKGIIEAGWNKPKEQS